MAAEQFGRISIGLYESNESFAANTDGEPYNDILSVSGRVYLHVTDINMDRMDMVMDLRDKYDAFGMLNSTKQELDPLNAFQAKNLYVSNFLSPSSKWNYITGRFSLFENGGAYTDGLGLQRKVTENSR